MAGPGLSGWSVRVAAAETGFCARVRMLTAVAAVVTRKRRRSIFMGRRVRLRTVMLQARTKVGGRAFVPSHLRRKERAEDGSPRICGRLGALHDLFSEAFHLGMLR